VVKKKRFLLIIYFSRVGFSIFRSDLDSGISFSPGFGFFFVLPLLLLGKKSNVAII